MSAEKTPRVAKKLKDIAVEVHPGGFDATIGPITWYWNAIRWRASLEKGGVLDFGMSDDPEAAAQTHYESLIEEGTDPAEPKVKWKRHNVVQGKVRDAVLLLIERTDHTSDCFNNEENKCVCGLSYLLGYLKHIVDADGSATPCPDMGETTEEEQ